MTDAPAGTEQEVLEAVGSLVTQGEYRDEILGIPGARLSGGGHFRGRPEGVYRRVYSRGSPEHVEARAAGLVERLPPLTRAPPRAVEEAEGILGHPLPLLLRRLYLEVGNGGFGPGYGVLGLRDGHRDDLGKTAVELFQSWRLPNRALFPICHWGCAIYSFVDCSDPLGTMWGWDPNPVPPEQALYRQRINIVEWFARWTRRRLHQPAVIEDPETGEWRGATEEELDELSSE